MTKLYEVELNSKGMPNFSTAKEVPQRIKGRWKLLPGRDDEHIRYLHCSVCHFNGDYESNFCPNCGADMRGEQNGKNS